jgi:hypothetical protein
MVELAMTLSTLAYADDLKPEALANRFFGYVVARIAPPQQ